MGMGVLCLPPPCKGAGASPTPQPRAVLRILLWSQQPLTSLRLPFLSHCGFLCVPPALCPRDPRDQAVLSREHQPFPS